MKMVKKLLLGLVAVAAVISLTGCMPKDDDDNAIKKGIGKFSIDYTYEKAADGEDNYRAYRPTSLKHAGALVKLVFKADGDPEKSKLGVIFGLQETKKDGVKTRDFNIIGLAENGQYYVSSMYNIVDIQEYNFGATTTAAAGEPKEKEWIPITGGSSNLSLEKDDSGNTYAYVWYQADKSGNYKWAILDMTDDQAKAWKKLSNDDKAAGNVPEATKVYKSGTITGAFAAADKEPKYPISIYAMVKDGKHLKGEWIMSGYYLEAEEEE